jgi:ABC-type glycerol-3-phosphate transport system permease component
MKLTRALLIYAALLLGSAVFAWPFIWMVSTSAKLERELFAEHAHILPQSPQARLQSPYLDNRTFADTTGPRLEEALNIIENQLKSMELDRTIAIKETARGIYARLLTTVPGEAWEKPTNELSTDIAAAISPQLIADVATQLRRVLCIGQLRVRSYDLQEDQLIAPQNAAASWQVGGTARSELVQAGSTAEPFAELHYDFSHGDLVTLAQTFTTTFPISRLHRIQLYLRNDDTWHAINLIVEKNGARFRAEHAIDDADFNWVVDTWQERGPDDRPDKIRTWTLLREVDRGPQFVSDPNQIKITVELSHRNLWQAWGAKILRRDQSLPHYSEFGWHPLQLLVSGL